MRKLKSEREAQASLFVSLMVQVLLKIKSPDLVVLHVVALSHMPHVFAAGTGLVAEIRTVRWLESSTCFVMHISSHLWTLITTVGTNADWVWWNQTTFQVCWIDVDLHANPPRPFTAPHPHPWFQVGQTKDFYDRSVCPPKPTGSPSLGILQLSQQLSPVCLCVRVLMGEEEGKLVWRGNPELRHCLLW